MSGESLSDNDLYGFAKLNMERQLHERYVQGGVTDAGLYANSGDPVPVSDVLGFGVGLGSVSAVEDFLDNALQILEDGWLVSRREGSSQGWVSAAEVVSSGAAHLEVTGLGWRMLCMVLSGCVSVFPGSAPGLVGGVSPDQMFFRVAGVLIGLKQRHRAGLVWRVLLEDRVPKTFSQLLS